MMPSAIRVRKRRDSLELRQYAKSFQEKYILHPFWIDSSPMSKKLATVADVPDVNIAEAGCFKYILVRVSTDGQSKLVGRGDASCAYHGRSWPMTTSDTRCISSRCS